MSTQARKKFEHYTMSVNLNFPTANVYLRQILKPILGSNCEVEFSIAEVQLMQGLLN